MKPKEQFLCRALDIFKEMISNDECSKTDIEYFCNLSKYELDRRGASIDKKQWIDKKEVCRILEKSRATLDRMVQKGELPRGKKTVGKKSLMWKNEEIEHLKRRMILKVKD